MVEIGTTRLSPAFIAIDQCEHAIINIVVFIVPNEIVSNFPHRYHCCSLRTNTGYNLQYIYFECKYPGGLPCDISLANISHVN